MATLMHTLPKLILFRAARENSHKSRLLCYFETDQNTVLIMEILPSNNLIYNVEIL